MTLMFRKSTLPRHSSFTLIELLVTLAVIAILAALLVSTISRSRERAQAVSCQNVLRQVWLATSMYVDDSHGFMPTLDFFYGEGKMNPRCPGVWSSIPAEAPNYLHRGFDWYGWGGYMDGVKFETIDSRTWLVNDSQPWHDSARTCEEDDRGIEYWTGKHNFLSANGQVGVQELWHPRMDR